MFDKIVKKIPVIIDTDIGDDIDDAVALCIAMQSPEIELLGVTTVFQNTQCRARIAKHLLDLGGFGHVPVYAGIGKPQQNTKIYGHDFPIGTYRKFWQDEWDDIPLPDDTDAVGFLIRTLESAAEPVTIVTLGALTNIAELLRRRPDLVKKIKQLSIMGGSYVRNMCEYNFACDPEAAAQVLASSVPMRAVGVDITLMCMFGDNIMQALTEMKHPCIRMLMEMSRAWGGNIYLHDPLALVTVFQPSLVEWRRSVYRVECEGKLARGMCIHLSDFNWNFDASSSPLEVAVDVHPEDVVKLCAERLLQFDCDLSVHAPEKNIAVS